MVFDKNGKSLGAHGGAVRAADNSVRKDGWYRVEGVTRVLPAEAARARFHIWSYDGVGEAFVDNIHLSFTVLYAIGHWVVFRVGGWSPRLPTRFHVSGRTLDTAQLSSFSPT